MPDPTPPAWDEQLLADPHQVADKRRRVQQMFSAIAPSYDLNNRLHSFWRDQAWRRKAVKLAELRGNEVVVDVACGTGDLIEAFRQAADLGGSQQADAPSPKYLGVDFTYDMLPIARRKSRFYNLCSTIHFINGDAQALPLPDGCCDVVSIAFGIRNVQEPTLALREFRRVLRPGGCLIILEFSQPTNPVLRALNHFYTARVMPFTATLISRDKSGAYKYLPRSVQSFVSRQDMMRMITDAGFRQVQQFPFTFGVCVCYRGYAG